MRKILITIGLMLVLFSLPMMSAIGGQNTISNITGNQSPLDFVITTAQVTGNPGIGQNVTYNTSIVISSRAAVRFNLTNFSLNLPDNNSLGVLFNTSFILTNATAGGIGNATADEFWIGQAADQFGWLVFYGLSGFNADVGSNGTANATTWNLVWTAPAPIGTPTKIATSLSGRTYTETWNITNVNSNLTVTNASLVVTPARWNLRIGAPTAVTFNATTLTTSGYTTNYTDIEAWTDLNIGTNMIEGGSGYGTLSISYTGPAISTSSGSSASAVSIVPIETRNVAVWVVIGISLIAVISVVVFVLVKKR